MTVLSQLHKTHARSLSTQSNPSLFPTTLSGERDLESIARYLENAAESGRVPGRLIHLLSPSVKSKTSDYFALFGPLGAAMFGQMRDMDARCRKALIHLVQALGDLYDKTPRWWVTVQCHPAMISS
jgi:hypothetical protein